MDDTHQNPNDDWSKMNLFHLNKTKLFCLGITFCVIGTACLNNRLLTALDDRYVFECINNEREVLQTLSQTKHFLSKRQLKIYVVDSFDENTFYSLKENENIYIISSELVLTCAEKKIVCTYLMIYQEHEFLF